MQGVPGTATRLMAVAMLLAGCAAPQQQMAGRGNTGAGGPATLPAEPTSFEAREDAWFALSLDAQRPVTATSGGDVLSGLFDFGGPVDFFEYQARYSLQRGDVVGSGFQPDAVPTQLGEQVFNQQIAATLPYLIGAPLTLELNDEQSQAWNVEGASVFRQERSAGLRWDPRRLAIAVQWTLPDAGVGSTRVLSCTASGRATTPVRTGGGSPALLFEAASCDGLSPSMSADALRVARWSTGWRWGDRSRTQTLRWTWVDAAAEGAAPHAGDSRGYELSLEQARTRGRWLGEASLGLRDSTDATMGWTAEAMLRRQLQWVGLEAGWQRAEDPLWFSPELRDAMNVFSLGLNLTDWARTAWSVGPVDTSVQYRWMDDSTADSGGDQIVEWKITRRW